MANPKRSGTGAKRGPVHRKTDPALSIFAAPAAPLTDRLSELGALIPEAVTEGRVDFDALRGALGDWVDGDSERYSFTWAGKRTSTQLLQLPSRASLIPKPEESIDFEQSRHIFIEGDNLEVLKLLYKSYFGRIKMIYIDPPYNTGADVIYQDNYVDPLESYLALTAQKDSVGNLLTSNPETGGRYHSSWLSMMYPRLFLARQLLSEDGLIFVSIDDHELHNLRMLMNEIFGEENRIETFIWKKSYGGGAKETFAVTQHEYILLYARDLKQADELWLPPDPEIERRYYKYKDEKFATRGPYRLKPLEATKSMGRRENLVYPIPLPDGGEVWPKRQWWWSKERSLKALTDDELIFTKTKDGWSVSFKLYFRDETGKERGAKPFSIIDGIYTQQGSQDLQSIFGALVMPFPKPAALMKRLLSMATDGDAGHLVLDFFAGSCPLAQAVLELNAEDGGDRRFIMVQLPEPVPEDSTAAKEGFSTIAEIGKERIRRVISTLRAQRGTKLDLGGDEGEELGFRVFELSESQFERWTGVEEMDPDAYAQQMALFVDPLVEGWQPTSVLWEIALLEGYGLSACWTPEPSPKKNRIWRVYDPDKLQSFLICLDDELKRADVKALNLHKDDVFICRDMALTDELAANLALQCRLKTI